jgi:hypothetical protein
MKSLGRSAFWKAPLALFALSALSLAACVVLTDPAPLTLPKRAQRFVEEAMQPVSRSTGAERFPPLVDVPVASLDAGFAIDDASFVVGVELNGASRAYPINMLSRPDRHVLNDTLGGEAIAVTWCGLCQSPAVYARDADGKTLTLFVTGELHGENMLIGDVETGSEWIQMLGEAVKGPMRGKTLRQIPSVWTDWKTWRGDHAETTLLKISPTVDYYRHDPDPASPHAEERYFSSMQWGLTRAGQSASWPLKELARHRAFNDSLAGLPLVVVFDSRSATVSAFERLVGNAELTFRLDREGLVDAQTSSVWDPVTGRSIRGKLAGQRLKPLAGVISHERAWRTLHPDTTVRIIEPRSA